MAQVTVTIAGRPYRMSCGDGEEPHIEALARVLDGKIGELRGSFGEIGDQRMTVMAALTLADDLLDARRRIEELEADTKALRTAMAAAETISDNWADRLAEGLADAAQRIEDVSRALNAPTARPAWDGDSGGAEMLPETLTGHRLDAPKHGMPPMKREDLVEKILDIKREKNWTWKMICADIGGLSPILITAALLGQMKLPKLLAAKAATLFGLTNVEAAMLNEAPYRGSVPTLPPTDPLIYRFYELVMVYGTTFKELIQEDFGDGIMSAIDFDMTMERQPNPKGDRVKLTMSGKFLPYKYYGNSEDVPDYGFKEQG